MRRLIALLVSFVLLLPGQAGLGRTAPEPAPEPVSAPGGLRLISSTETSLLIELVSPAYEIEHIVLDGSSYDRLSLPGAVHTSQKGFPQLPVYPALLGIPPDAEISLVVRDIETSPVEVITACRPSRSLGRISKSFSPLKWFTNRMRASTAAPLFTPRSPPVWRRSPGCATSASPA